MRTLLLCAVLAQAPILLTYPLYWSHLKEVE